MAVVAAEGQGQPSAEDEMEDWCDIRGKSVALSGTGTHRPIGEAWGPTAPLHEAACVIEACLSPESENTRVQFPAEVLSCCVILSKLLGVSESVSTSSKSGEKGYLPR